MSKRLLNLMYLIKKNQRVTITTKNIHNFVNKIPCDEEAFLNDPAELYVTHEMEEYPINLEHS